MLGFRYAKSVRAAAYKVSIYSKHYSSRATIRQSPHTSRQTISTHKKEQVTR
jgi:hypothetical protein